MEEKLEVICEVDKRRKCDSFYITLYNKLMKDFTKQKTELEETKQLLNIYKTIMNEQIDILKEGDYNAKR